MKDKIPPETPKGLIRFLKPPYFVEWKNGTHSAWKDTAKFKSFDRAISKCSQLMKQNRGKNGTEYYQTRVSVKMESGVRLRVFPYQFMK